MKKVSIIVRITAVVIFIILLAVAIVIPTGIYTNGFESVRTRYLAVDGSAIKKNGSTVLGKEMTVFELKGAGFKAVDWGEYSVTIETNSEYGIEFTLNGKECQYGGTDITEYFTLAFEKNSFAITGDYSVKTILKKLYGNGVEITKEVSPSAAAYVMTVTPEKGKAAKVYLVSYFVAPEGIDISPSGDDLVLG